MATISIGSSLDSRGFNELNEKLDKAAAKVQSTSAKLSKATKIGLASISATASGAAAFAVNATMKLEDANVQLENSFKNAGTSVEAHKEQLDKVQQQMEKFGYSGDQTRAALARMTTVTGSADKALQSIGLAADIAKNRHVDLEKAGDLLSKTMAGSTTAAKKMGIAIPDSVKKIEDPAQKANVIMGILQERFKGSAAAAAGTFGGKMEAVKAKISDAAATIGSKLVPIVMKLVDITQNVVKWLSKHKDVTIALAAAVGVIAVAALVNYTAGMLASAAATIAATWPIILIIGAIALLVAGVIYAYNHFTWFRTGVKAVWRDVQIAVKFAWQNVILPVFKIIAWYIRNVVVPQFKIMQAVVGAVFEVVVSIIQTAWNVISTVFGWISGAINGLIGAFQTIVGGIGAAFSGLADIILAPFKFAFNGIASLWNNTVGQLSFKTPSWLGPLGNLGFSMPKIPEWKAVGGPVMGGNPYIVGEKGPELFVPGASGSIVPNHRLGGTVVQNITITSNDPQQVVNALIRYQQRNGSIPIRTAA